MKSKKLRANAMLLLTAFIWGMSFVAQRKGMESVSPFTFNATRCIIGGLVLIPCIRFLDKGAPGKWPILGGIVCGFVLFLASTMQQHGLVTSTAGKSGFITALYIVMVPIFGVFLKKRAAWSVWLGAVLAVYGMYLLCVTESFKIEVGDLYLLLGSVFFAFHILVIDYFAPHVDCVRMSCLQFLTCGVLSAVSMWIFETPTWGGVLDAGLPILYAGVLSCGVAYTLQTVAQKNTDPASVALICSLESVFALLGGWLFMHEDFTGREILGCVITFAAILLSQIPTIQYRKDD